MPKKQFLGDWSMSMTRIALLLAMLGLSVAPVSAEPPRIDRTIRNEAVYQTKTPKYGLLVFGPEAKDRVWLVLDGDTLYVDRTGNGDLTEADKKVAVESRPGLDPEKYGYSLEIGELTIGGRRHKAFTIYFVPLKGTLHN